MKLKTYHDEIYVQYYSMLAPSTVPGYESSWQLYIEPKFGDWEIEQIRVRDINLWLTEFDSAWMTPEGELLVCAKIDGINTNVSIAGFWRY